MLRRYTILALVLIALAIGTVGCPALLGLDKALDHGGQQSAATADR